MMRTTVVTGVSRGLGAALFDEFCAAGDRVLALGRQFSDAQQEAADAEPDRILLRMTDLADPATLPDAAELASFVDAGEGEVVFIHSAADFEPFGPIGALVPEDVANAVAVNFTAPMLLTNALLAPLPIDGTVEEPVREVTVLYVSSSAAHRVSGGRAVYGSTKRGGEMFFESLADERGTDARVRVVIVDPGIMDTEMQVNIRAHAREDAYFPGRERFIDRYDRGALPSPVDVARRIVAEHLN
jgi:benzil reductase ((S)-benzoin forming)